jgi:putative hydrolase of HD superfamily
METQTLLRLLDYSNDLKLLPRTGWLLAGIRPAESVADHTYATALLALALAQRINSAPDDHGLAQPLDAGRVVQLALVHDLAESILTDLPQRSSHVLGKKAKHQAEEDALQQILAEEPNMDWLLALWREYNQTDSPEAQLVRDADKLEMVHQSLRYQRASHAGLAEFRQGHRWNFELSAQIFSALSTKDI